jgi:O-acetyl-ADP-ribose deacetylase (regulator of RNase III)
LPVREVDGDLLADDAQVLVNAVNTVGVMGAGIALAFKNAYPAMFESYRQACMRAELDIGRYHMVQVTPGRFVYNFPTKRYWRDPSRPSYIAAGLPVLASVLTEQEIASVALPALGCGHGGLDWPLVRAMIDTSLCGHPTDIRLYRPPTKWKP